MPLAREESLSAYGSIQGTTKEPPMPEREKKGRDTEVISSSMLDAAAGAKKARGSVVRVDVDLAAMSDIGKARSNNEDHYLAVKFGRFLNCLQTNLGRADVPRHFEQTGYGLLVADGMGGMAAGEVASRLAITTMVDLVLETPDWIMGGDEVQAGEVERRTAERMQQAADVLTAESQQNPALAGMGTTLTLAISLGADLLVAHVGDSRAYLYRDDKLHRLTRDHTFAQEMADAGLISVSDIARHRMRHVLTRSLGDDRSVRAEFRRTELRNGDRLLLCSDGLHDLVEDAAIAEVLSAQPTSHDACLALIDRALSAGGKDNVTVVLAKYTIPE
ncbi:MAG: protein phosphatase 2C domain-containing protein [Pirellulales bacterium]